MSAGVRIHVVDTVDVELVMAADVFDGPPRHRWASDFLARSGHHLLLAMEGERAVGFVTGIEIAHPDKPLEMLLYELGVNESHRRRGIGSALVTALAELARGCGCEQMWVPTDAGDDVAAAVYRSAGAGPVEDAGFMTWHFGRPKSSN